MRRLLSITCFLLACHAVQAGDPTKANAAVAKATPTVDVKPASIKADTAATTGTAGTAGATEYAPKTKSVFRGTMNERNPFWPIGWVKVDSGTSTDNAPAPVVPHSEDFSVSTIMLNEPPMAVINGKDMAEGEVATLNVNGQPVMVQLMAVQDGRVILRWQNQNLIVPIHRDEVLSRANSLPVAVGTQ